MIQHTLPHRNVSTSNEYSKSQFDAAKFNEFTKGCEDTQPEIMDAIIEDTPLLLLELDKSLNANQANKTSKLIHKLKSSVSLICTDRLLNEIREFERTTILICTPEFLSSGRRVILKVSMLLNELRQIRTEKLQCVVTNH